MPKPHRRQATWAPKCTQVSVAVVALSSRIAHVRRCEQRPSLNKSPLGTPELYWGPRNFTQNCLKRSVHTSLQVSYCVFNPVQEATPFSRSVDTQSHTLSPRYHECPPIARVGTTVIVLLGLRETVIRETVTLCVSYGCR